MFSQEGVFTLSVQVVMQMRQGVGLGGSDGDAVGSVDVVCEYWVLAYIAYEFDLSTVGFMD